MQSVGMIFYILFFGCIAGGLWTGLNHRSTESSVIQYGVKSVLFFFAFLYFIVSATKFYLGEAENTLVESFWDVEGITYLHYGGVLIVISLIMPLLMKRLFSVYGNSLVHIFDTIYVAGIMINLLLFRQITNRYYCILYVLCILVGFGIITIESMFGKRIAYHKHIEYIRKIEIWSYFREALPFVCAWVVMTGIYFPNELYIHNPDEFMGGYAAFFLIMLAGSIIEIFLLIGALLLFLTKKLIKIICLLFAGVSCAGYLQSMFLNGTLNAMNGEEQAWSGQKLLVNMCIWLIILLIAVVGGYKNKTISNICKLLCVYVSLIQIVTLGLLLVTTDIKNRNVNAAITNKGSLELAQDNNVLVFVLDNFDSDWFEEIYCEDSSILEPLADFTYYRNGTSQFAHTNNAIPYMLTGVEWSAGKENYFEYAYESSDVLQRIAEHGTSIRIFTDLSLMPEKVYQLLDHYSDTISRKYNISKTFTTMVRTSMYKTAPFLMKHLYGYYSSDINDMSYNNDIWSIDNDILFYQNMLEEGLCISEDDESAFRFYHMRGPHAPFYLTEDLKYEPTGRGSSLHSQGKGSLKIVYEYIKQMKNLGIYEDATIIITADHGQAGILDSERYDGKPDRVSRTLFLVKKQSEHHDDMEISDAPVSQAELIPTILQALGMDYDSCGRTFEKIPVDERRVREYIDVYSNYSIEYMIDGHAADLDSWSIESAEYN